MAVHPHVRQGRTCVERQDSNFVTQIGRQYTALNFVKGKPASNSAQRLGRVVTKVACDRASAPQLRRHARRFLSASEVETIECRMTLHARTLFLGVPLVSRAVRRCALQC